MRAKLATTPAHVYAWATSLVAIVGMIVLAALHDPIPAVLDVVAGGSVGAGAGLSKPSE